MSGRVLSSALFTHECGTERNVQLLELLEFDFALPWRGGVHTAPGVLGRVFHGNGRACRRGWGRFWAVLDGAVGLQGCLWCLWSVLAAPGALEFSCCSVLQPRSDVLI